eukprot:COSAG02_NODE_7796_length_2841_cov_25.255288_2_plen_248_part_00
MNFIAHCWERDSARVQSASGVADSWLATAGLRLRQGSGGRIGSVACSMQLVIEEEEVAAGHRTTAGKVQGPSPLMDDMPSSPGSRTSSCSTSRADCPTPMVVRSNVQRRTVGIGEDGLTPVVVREVELTPTAERNAKPYAPSVSEELLDFGSPLNAKPTQKQKPNPKPKQNQKQSHDCATQLQQLTLAPLETGANADNQKKLRKAQKLLRQIEQLQASAEAGQPLNTAQQAKLDRRAEVEADIARYS